MLYENFGYHVVNEKITLKDGRDCTCKFGRYFWGNELGGGQVSGIYYVVLFDKNITDLIHESEIKFPIQ